MKVLYHILFCLLFTCAFLSNANAEEKVSREQVDTLVARVFRKQLIFSPMYQQVRKDDSDGDKLIREYLAFERLSDLVYGELKDIPSADLRNMIHFTGTHVYFRLATAEFWNTFKMYIHKAEQDEKFDYQIRDIGYAALVDRLKGDYASLMKVADQKALIPLRNTGIYTPKVLGISRDKLPVLLVKTLMEYFSYEEFIASRPECWEIHTLVGEKSADPLRILIGGSYADAMGDALLNSQERLDRLSEYMKISREPLYISNYLYRPTAELTIKKGQYKGETYDGIPDGEGILIDKKGIEYSGSFRNGLRHGHINVINPKKSADTLVQCWYKGRVRKDIPSAMSLQDGIQVVPEAMEIDGKRFGFGCCIQGTINEGFFIDGKLSGEGIMETGASRITGYFNGNLIRNCTIVMIRDNPKYKENSFVGIQQDNMRKGVLVRVEKKDNVQRVWDGEFVNTVPDGVTSYSVIRSNDTTRYYGAFAFGNQYGYGNVERNCIHDDGTSERMKYEGTIIKNVPHGKGSSEIILTSLPQEKFSFLRFGLNLSDEYAGGQDTVVVNLEGKFKDGNLSEGNVSFSNGTYMEGSFSEGVLAKGRLVKKSPDGLVYDGICRSGKYNGYGTITHPDGTVYEALFEDGLSVGMKKEGVSDWGFLKNFTESRSFKIDGLIDKRGVSNLVYAAGVKLKVRGQASVEVVCTGKFDGENIVAGKVTVSDGTWSEGIFEDGVLISGRGKTIDRLGAVYTGEIKNGLPHGKGECHYKDGTVFKGNFVNGNRMGGTHYTSDGKVIKSLVDYLP